MFSLPATSIPSIGSGEHEAQFHVSLTSDGNGTNLEDERRFAGWFVVPVKYFCSGPVLSQVFPELAKLVPFSDSPFNLPIQLEDAERSAHFPGVAEPDA